MLANVIRKDKPYKLFDGKGLYIEVPPRGNLRWRFKYLFNCKENRISLGLYPALSIIDARERKQEFEKMISEGINPADIQKEARETKAKIQQQTIDNKIKKNIETKFDLYKRIDELEELLLMTRSTIRDMVYG